MPKSVGGRPQQLFRSSQGRLYDPRSWKARLVKLFKGKSYVKLSPSTSSSPAGSYETRKNRADRVRRAIALRDTEHYSNPERAAHTLDKQRRRTAGVPYSPVMISSQDKEMVSFKKIASGSFGTTDAVVPNGAGPISVRKKNRKDKSTTKHLEELKKEEQLLQKLDHPNIIKTAQGHRVTADDPVMYMEHGGSTLSHLISSQKKPLPKYLTGKTRSSRKAAPKKDAQVKGAMAIHVCRQVLEGLVYLSSKGVVHRDLKPDNILISPANGHVRIGDFGLAAEVGSPKMRLVAGTPNYFAPEVMTMALGWNKKSYDGKVDVFSAGCMFYELLTGMRYKGVNPDCKYESYPKALAAMEERNLHKWLSKRINPKKTPSLTKAEAERMVNMLTGMLEFDPHKRWTPRQARMALNGEPVPLPPVKKRTLRQTVSIWFKNLI
ncbi:serine/threonine-protein kinase [Sansalvadorimonas verongulae]|uniref:serine/threonine-protein kinase n=1 Tax=Sansalvadorimonas verongulae TaxID=2172824 RepID=UPI0018AD27B4|nr:serine/threonine-protein kinase [Sansalvadorimonas verongulae]